MAGLKSLDLERGVYTIPEVAVRLGISKASAYRASLRGELPGKVQVGSCVRYSRAEIDALVDGKRTRRKAA